MKVRRGKTPFPLSPRHAGTDVGHITSTIWVAESKGKFLEPGKGETYLPRKLTNKTIDKLALALTLADESWRRAAARD